MRILVTGAAGFIGSRTASELLRRKKDVVGLDDLNDYYDVRLKRYRLRGLEREKRFRFVRATIEDRDYLERLFRRGRFEAVINLAARAGVRYSMKDPFVYERTNAGGTLNLLECCRKYRVGKFILASTSSLYAGQPMPFSEGLAVNTPISPYAATKKAAEAMCYAYHYLYGTDVTVLRYFTVYGPAGRPDMSLFRFIQWIQNDRTLDLFGDGSQSRDFTYVDDIARGTVSALKKVGFKTINLGGDRPCSIAKVIAMIEKSLGKKAKVRKLPFHKADIKATWADIRQAGKVLGWTPKVPLEDGVERTVRWHEANRSWLDKIVL